MTKSQKKVIWVYLLESSLLLGGLYLAENSVKHGFLLCLIFFGIYFFVSLKFDQSISLERFNKNQINQLNIKVKNLPFGIFQFFYIFSSALLTSFIWSKSQILSMPFSLLIPTIILILCWYMYFEMQRRYIQAGIFDSSDK